MTTGQRAFLGVHGFFAVAFAVATLAYAFGAEQVVANWTGPGGAPGPEDGVLWHTLAVGNVAALSVCCGLLAYDRHRYWPVRFPLWTMKGIAALGFGLAWPSDGALAYLVAFAADGATLVALVGTALVAGPGDSVPRP